MAKKKKRKRRIQPAPVMAPPPGARQERKEAARRERERIIRAARRRRFLVRAARWGVVLLVIAGIAGFVAYRFYQDRRLLERADAAAEAIGCGEIQNQPSQGRDHVDTPPEYTQTPATSGPHSSAPLPGDQHVYTEPLDAPGVEFRAVHNLEHAYVIIYYRAEGPEALSPDMVDALADLARGEQKVFLAPYAELPEGTSLAFAAWTKLLECPRVSDSDSAVLVAQGFVKRFRGTSNAPEPNGA